MATIVRVKRRRDEDPLEILLLSNKKPKLASATRERYNTDTDENALKFAGTVYSKDSCISKPVREAIRKEKLEREYKQHQANVLGEVKQESRRSQKHHAEQSRFRVTAKHRAIELDLLDQARLEKKAVYVTLDKDSETDKACVDSGGDSVREEPNVSTLQKAVDAESNGTETSHQKVDKEEILCECGKHNSCKCESDTNTNCNKIEVGKRKTTGANCNPNGSNTKSANEEKQDRGDEVMSKDVKSDRMFCLVDMEADVPPVTYESPSAETNEIVCNGVPLEREVVSERGSDDLYVYDLYYTNSRDFDFRWLENALTVEAFGSSLRGIEEDFEEEGGGDDDEDSNDEGNWRNDYPDEDPGFVDNQDVGYYGNDMDENLAFETETGNQLADWMSWRCNIENEVDLSSDDEVQEYETSGKSYEAYYTRVKRELNIGGGSDESDSDS